MGTETAIRKRESGTVIGGSNYSAGEYFLLSRYLIIRLFDNLPGIIDTASEMWYAPPLIYQRHSTYSDRYDFTALQHTPNVEQKRLLEKGACF